MSWIVTAVVAVGLLAAVLWWINRPLFYRCQNPELLEDFLRDFVSERSPWPTMEIHLRNRHLLTLRRERGVSGIFELTLEATDGSLDPIAIGPTSTANLRPAADVARAILISLGVSPNVALKIRYAGPMDPVVVARARASSSWRAPSA